MKEGIDMGKITSEQIDKWIKIVKIGAELETEVLKHPDIIKRERVSYDDIKTISDELWKLQDFLEKSKVDYRFQPPNYIARLLHKTVTIELNNGEDVEGVVDGFNNYEIRIKTDTEDLLIQKHAIVYIKGDLAGRIKPKKKAIRKSYKARVLCKQTQKRKR